jgi:hypothetical protein
LHDLLHGIGVELGEKYFENRFQEFDIEGFLDAWAETRLVGIRNSDRNTWRDGAEETRAEKWSVDVHNNIKM